MTTDPLDIEQTLRQIGEGRAHIDRVRAIIAKLETSESDTTLQRDLLKSWKRRSISIWLTSIRWISAQQFSRPRNPRASPLSRARCSPSP